LNKIGSSSFKATYEDMQWAPPFESKPLSDFLLHENRISDLPCNHMLESRELYLLRMRHDPRVTDKIIKDMKISNVATLS
jgi:hypothetical protein